MNNIIANFEQILKFAASYGLPPTKNGAYSANISRAKYLILFTTKDSP